MEIAVLPLLFLLFAATVRGQSALNDLEAALVETIPPGQYTAQVRGKNDSTGIGVVQVYFLQ